MHKSNVGVSQITVTDHKIKTEHENYIIMLMTLFYTFLLYFNKFAISKTQRAKLTE